MFNVLVFLFPDDPTIFPTVAVGTFGIILGIPFLSVGGVSLYSKITDERTQGRERKAKISVIALNCPHEKTSMKMLFTNRRFNFSAYNCPCSIDHKHSKTSICLEILLPNYTTKI